MARSQFSLYARRGSSKTKPTYYVRIWRYATKNFAAAVSTRILAEHFGLALSEYNPHLRSGARKIVETCLALGYRVPETANKRPTLLLAEYLLTFWDWTASSYVKGKLLRREGSIGRAYVQNNRSWCERYVIPNIGRLPVLEVSPHDVEAWFLRLREESKLTNRTLNRVLQALRIPLREAHRLGTIPSDPTKPIRPLGELVVEKGILSREEIGRLLSVTWEDARSFVAFCVALVGGLRLGEIIALQKSKILSDGLDVAHSYSKVDGLKTTKTNKSRTVTLPARVLAMVRDLAARSPANSPWVFWSDREPSKPFYSKAIEKHFYLALAKIGISSDLAESGSRQSRNLTFHSLRHWFNATLNGTLPGSKLRKLTGHSSERMTAAYDHLTDEDRKLFTQAQEAKILSLFPLESVALP